MWRRTAWLGLLGLGGVSLVACVDPIFDLQGTGGQSGTGASVGSGGSAGPSVANKIDLVLAVDNSASMADKQQILALAIPDLIAGLVNPKCLDDTTKLPAVAQPAGALDACPSGTTREFPAVLDIHVGLISSSLGTLGADGCPDKPPAVCPSADTTPLDDHGHLVTRSDACDSKGPIPTYQSQGFLAWDPGHKLQPPGIADIGAIGNAGPNSGSGLVGMLHDLVVGNGQAGCGFESQNESWYRFLVDPTPYGSISLDAKEQVVINGTDSALLAQRKEFLRPDSLLAIVVLSDETDTSIKQYSSYPLFAAPEIHLPHARAECKTNGPKDPCCASCGQGAPAGCPVDMGCATNPNYGTTDEDTSIRAFGLITHKTSYGIEFFYPPSRYVAALTSPTVLDINNKTVPNPIFTNLDPTNYTGATRGSSLVFYAAIVGVPWQLIARQNGMGAPDLIGGVSAVDPTQVGGFKTAQELSLTDPHGNIFWDDIAGDPENYVPAKSPFMVESSTPRSGTDPITGAAISPTTTPNGGGAKVGTSKYNLVNDHEWTVKSPPNDIEYACIFPLATPVDESGANSTSGDCGGNPKDNPLCSPNPNDSMKNTLQTSAKAYPGIKHLAIARGMGSRGIVGSVCPAQLTDPTAPDYGYRPAVKAIVDALKPALGAKK